MYRISSKTISSYLSDALSHMKLKVAIIDEMEAREKNGTWALTDLSIEKSIPVCKWVYTLKYNPEMYANLVVRVSLNLMGKKIISKHSPIANLSSLLVILSVIANLPSFISVGCVSAFLHSDF